MLLARTPRGDLIHDVDAVAASLGLAPGGRATDALAAHRDLAVAYADPRAEARALRRLAGWARRWSPLTRPDGTHGIALDATGCTHLFGGEAAMLDAMAERLSALGLTVRLAMAPNHAAAHALARFGAAKRAVVDDESLAGAIGGFPVAALRIDAGSVTLLRRLGLKTVGDADRIPRASLKKRFGAGLRRRDARDDTWEDYLGRATDTSGDVLARLDEAMGRLRIPLDPDRPVPHPRVLRGLEEPVLETEVVLAFLRPMLERLAEGLAERDEGVRVLGVEAFRVDGGRATAVLRLSRPSRDVAQFMRLLPDRLDGWRADFGFDALAVEALEVAALPPGQEAGLAGEAKRPPDPFALIDRLRTRLGEGAVRRPALHDSHVPERAEAWMPMDEAAASSQGPGAGQGSGSESGRPERMFDFPEEIGVVHALPDGPPARFTWRRRAHDVARAAGPERIAPEWWRERSHVRARDYWRVETRKGRRLWMFREGFPDDERGQRMRWFVHGLFS